MATTVINRGTTITFVSSFFNSSGSITNPNSAYVYVTWPLSGSNVTSKYGMTVSSYTWTATWESSASQVGEVAWSVRAEGGSPFIAEDGVFQLSGNRANPGP